MKKFIYLIFISLALLSSCDILNSDNEDETVKVKFTLKNELLWHVGHDYKVGYTNKDGKSVVGEEKYINYYDVLLDAEIKKGSKITLYKNGNSLWISNSVKKNVQYIYHDTPYSDGDYVDTY